MLLRMKVPIALVKNACICQNTTAQPHCGLTQHLFLTTTTSMLTSILFWSLIFPLTLAWHQTLSIGTNERKQWRTQLSPTFSAFFPAV